MNNVLLLWILIAAVLYGAWRSRSWKLAIFGLAVGLVLYRGSRLSGDLQDRTKAINRETGAFGQVPMASTLQADGSLVTRYEHLTVVRPSWSREWANTKIEEQPSAPSKPEQPPTQQTPEVKTKSYTWYDPASGMQTGVTKE
jgi:hypothetical protein